MKMTKGIHLKMILWFIFLRLSCYYSLKDNFGAVKNKDNTPVQEQLKGSVCKNWKNWKNNVTTSRNTAATVTHVNVSTHFVNSWNFWRDVIWCVFIINAAPWLAGSRYIPKTWADKTDLEAVFIKPAIWILVSDLMERNKPGWFQGLFLFFSGASSSSLIVFSSLSATPPMWHCLSLGFCLLFIEFLFFSLSAVCAISGRQFNSQVCHLAKHNLK